MAQPEWKSWLTAPQRAVFLQSLQAVFDARGLQVSISSDALVMGDIAVDLLTLAQRCAQAEVADYPQVIEANIDDLLLSCRDTIASTVLDQDWEQARAWVKLRLLPLEQISGSEDELISAPIGADLAIVLVYDLPDSVVSVLPEAAAGWPVNGAELWPITLDNLRDEDPPPEVERIVLAEGVDAFLVSGESLFITSRLLLLGDILPPERFPQGALVIVPHRHVMVLHPILDQGVYDAMAGLSLMGQEMFASGPGPLSPAVYWWQGNAIERIEITVDVEADEVTLSPSEALDAMLEALPPLGSEEAPTPPERRDGVHIK